MLSLPLLRANPKQPNLVAVSCLIMAKVTLCDIFWRNYQLPVSLYPLPVICYLKKILTGKIFGFWSVLNFFGLNVRNHACGGWSWPKRHLKFVPLLLLLLETKRFLSLCFLYWLLGKSRQSRATDICFWRKLFGGHTTLWKHNQRMGPTTYK